MNGAPMGNVLKNVDFMRLNNPSHRRKGQKQEKIIWFYAAKTEKKIIQWSPLWIIFKGKMKIAHLLRDQSAC